MIRIIDVQTDSELMQVKDLFRAYYQFLAQEDGLDLSNPGLEEELAALPGIFAPPEGRLVMAVTGEQAMGCAALRRVDEKVCELKRMFVLPQFRGQGVGKALARTLIEQARTMGYERMQLDTGTAWGSAIQLYESLGFQRVEPSSEVPEDLRKISVFMERSLN
jgi:GNAT superfamily N-acetyltransferase